MSLADCAELVKEADEDRFLSAMAAKPEQRAALFPLYAFNVEVFRAAWASNEPMLCQMRLQYWRDMIEGIYAGAPSQVVPLAGPLAEVIKQGGLNKEHLLEMIDARSWDTGRDPFESPAHFSRYLEQTAGNLMVQAARVTGVKGDDYGAIMAHGYAMGLANFLIGVPDLIAHGRKPLLDESVQAIAGLAAEGLQRMQAVKGRKICGGQAALRAGWDSKRVLKLVAKHPDRVLQGRLQTSPFRRKTSLLMMSFMG